MLRVEFEKSGGPIWGNLSDNFHERGGIGSARFANSNSARGGVGEAAINLGVRLEQGPAGGAALFLAARQSDSS